MPETRLKDFLDKEHVKYVTIGHSPAYTAQEIAALTHTPGKELAKTVIVKVDGEPATASPLLRPMLECGFVRDYRGLVIERDYGGAAARRE